MIKKAYNPKKSYDHCSEHYWGLSEDYLQTRMVPRSMWDATITAYDPKDIDLVMKYLSTYTERMRRGDGLFINGPYGCGKTTLAVIIGMQLSVRGYDFLFARADKLVEESIQRNTFRCSYDGLGNDVEYVGMKPWACRVPVLILDNLGGELRNGNSNEYTSMVIKNVLKERCDEGIPTLLTSTLKKKTIRNVYGDSLIETIKEHVRTVTLRKVLRKDIDEWE